MGTNTMFHMQVSTIALLFAIHATTVSAAAVQSPFSIHVPLYNPHLSPSSNETRALIATASSSPNAPDISVAICSTWDFQVPSDVCDTTENNAAADLLRQAGITVLHYIPLQGFRYRRMLRPFAATVWKI